ncbi:MAG: S41 family peptidase [Fibrobacter sp.]|nr:S41 family peptidase [Fibrobacter sp.]
MEIQKDKKSSFGKIPLVGVVILVVVVMGLMVDATRADSDSFYKDIVRLDNVASKIHQNYVEEVSSKDLIDNAIKGMTHILDPHTTYFEEKEYQELKIHTEGKFGGLGIQISIRDKVLTVMTPIAGTPASRAGIQSGDQILKIDGKSTAGITIDNAVGKLRGEPGTKVTITIRRSGEMKDVDYTISREIIHIKSVPFSGVISDSIGYVQLTTFSEDAGAEVEKAIKELLKKGIKGLVFDLRHNPGGLLPQAIEVSEKFLPKKSLIVSTKGRVSGQNKESYSSSQPIVPPEMPLAVLVNYASASASEIVSGAIQDWDRGIVVGDTTFGKGSVQTLLPLDPTHTIKLTTAFYYTPSGRCINRPENSIRGNGDDVDEAGSSEGSTANADSSETRKSKIDTTVYKTKRTGRLVYGSGGIIPDTVVKIDIPALPVRALLVKDVFFQFANSIYPQLKKRNVKIDKDYMPDAATIKGFFKFLDSTKFTFQSVAQMRFEEFKKSAGLKDTVDSLGKKVVLYPELPKFEDAELAEMKVMVQRVDSVLVEESKRAVASNDKEIRKLLRDAILYREYGQDHEIYFRSKLADDTQLKAAVSLISNKDVYSSLLIPKKVEKTENAEKKEKVDKIEKIEKTVKDGKKEKQAK